MVNRKLNLVFFFTTYTAEKFGLPLPPPSKSKDEDFKNGANFAITGATAMESSFFKDIGVDGRIWNTGSIQTQIQWFEDLKPSLCSTEEGTLLDSFVAIFIHFFDTGLLSFSKKKK